MHRLALLAAVLIACGDNKVTPDAPLPPQHDAPTADAAPGPNAVTLSPFEAPDLVKYKDGASGAWFDAHDNGDGTFTLQVTDDYIVLVVCTGSGSSTDFDAEEEAHVFAEGTSITTSCQHAQDQGSGSGSGSGTTFQVSGTMVQAGLVETGDAQSKSQTANWTYNLTEPQGLHDLLAIGADNNTQITRDVDITADTTGPTFDVDANGVANPPQTLTLNNMIAGVQSFAFSGWATANEFFQLDMSSTTSVTMAPASLLQQNDFQFFQFFAFTQTDEQVAFLFQTGPTALPTTYDLIPQLTGTTFDATSTSLTAHWSTLPVSTFDTIAVEEQGNQSGTESQRISASQAWVTKTNATSLAFDTSAPGYKSVWIVDTTTTGFGDLAVSAADQATQVQYITATAAVPGFKKNVVTSQRARQLRHVKGVSRKILP